MRRGHLILKWSDTTTKVALDIIAITGHCWHGGTTSRVTPDLNQNVNGPGYLREWPPSYATYRQVRSHLYPGRLVELSYIRLVELAVKYPQIDGLLDPVVGVARVKAVTAAIHDVKVLVRILF